MNLDHLPRLQPHDDEEEEETTAVLRITETVELRVARYDAVVAEPKLALTLLHAWRTHRPKNNL